jgi:hypothetical protein
MASYFADVIKPTADFFKKTFSYDNKVELKSTAANGVAITAEGGISAKGTGFASLKGECKKGDVQVDKLSIASSGLLEGEFSLPNVAAGTAAKFAFKDGTRASGADTSAKFTVQTLQDLGVNTGLKVEVDAVKGVADASVLVKQGNIMLGAATSLDAHLADKSGMEVTGYDAVVALDQDGTRIGVQTSKKFANAVAFVHSKASSTVTVAGSATFGLMPAAPKPVNVGFGATYQWDASTKVSGALDDAGNVKLAYNLAVSPKATLNVYGEVKALDIAGDAHRFGTKLSLRA